jgi:ABC-type antimicrobial peptide transport system permease subunit
VLRQAGVLVITGVIIGTMAAAAAGRFVHSFLYGVAEHDALTLTVVAVVLLGSGGLAAYFPARKAARVNPVEALRAE